MLQEGPRLTQNSLQTKWDETQTYGCRSKAIFQYLTLNSQGFTSSFPSEPCVCVCVCILRSSALGCSSSYVCVDLTSKFPHPPSLCCNLNNVIRVSITLFRWRFTSCQWGEWGTWKRRSWLANAARRQEILNYGNRFACCLLVSAIRV